MNNPEVSFVEMDCQQCEVFEPTEGNCRDCLIKRLNGEKYGEEDV